VGVWEEGEVRSIGSEAVYVSVSLSPDGKDVAAIAQAPPGDALHLIDVTSGKERIVPLSGHGSPPEWARNSSAVAITGDEVLLVSRDGDVLARTTPDKRTPGGGAVVDVYSGWSPDGTMFAFATTNKLVVLDATSGERRDVAIDELTAAYGGPAPYMVVWYWDRLSSFIFASGISDGPTPDRFLALSVTSTLDPAATTNLGTFEPKNPVTGEPIRDTISLADSIAIKHGVNDLVSLEPTVDGSAWLYQLENDGGAVYLRDRCSADTARIEVTRPQYGSASVDAYIR
jgi:hypothetical protein